MTWMPLRRSGEGSGVGRTHKGKGLSAPGTPPRATPRRPSGRPWRRAPAPAVAPASSQAVDRAQVVAAADRRAVQAGRAPQRGEVDIREADQIERVRRAARSGGPRRRRRRRCRRRSASAGPAARPSRTRAAPSSRRRRPSAATVRRSGRATAAPMARRQAEPDRLERLREHEAARVRHPQVHRRVAHEVPGVDRDRPLRWAAGVQRGRQRARVDLCARRRRRRTGGRCQAPAGSARRAAGLRQPDPDTPRRSSSASSARAASAASPTTATSTRWCAPMASVSWSTWMTVAVGREQPAVARRPHVQRRADAQHDVGLRDQARPRSARRSRPRCRAPTGCPANSPLATADVASSAPSRSPGAPGPRAHRPARRRARPRSADAGLGPARRQPRR